MEAVARRRSQGKTATPVSPIGFEMVKRIDTLFDIERGTVGRSPEARKAVRQELSKPLIEDMHAYMLGQRARLSRGNDIAKRNLANPSTVSGKINAGGLEAWHQIEQLQQMTQPAEGLRRSVSECYKLARGRLQIVED